MDTSITLTKAMYMVSSYTDLADDMLQSKWPMVYENLMNCETIEDYRSWYIDDRADPKTFYALLCIAHPNIYTKITGRKLCKTKILKGLNYIMNNMYIEEEE